MHRCPGTQRLHLGDSVPAFEKNLSQSCLKPTFMYPLKACDLWHYIIESLNVQGTYLKEEYLYTWNTVFIETHTHIYIYTPKICNYQVEYILVYIYKCIQMWYTCRWLPGASSNIELPFAMQSSFNLPALGCANGQSSLRSGPETKAMHPMTETRPRTQRAA